jgi:cytochrome c553
MKKLIGLSIVTLGLACSSAFGAGDPAAGKAKAAMCASCHGANGISGNDLWPNLAGQKEGYLYKQIKAFKDGSRNDPMMKPMVASLSDADMRNLAAYYASLK